MWEKLKENRKPLVLYGTGSAAEKIMKELDIRGLRVSGIFASDGFVRDRYFQGFKVLSYDDAKDQFGDMCVLLCFGSHRPEVLENIQRIASEQEFYAPDLPVAGEGLFDREYYGAHREELARVRERLADDQSRFVFDSVIEYKLTGRIEPLLACQTPEEENWQLFCDVGSTFLDLGAYTGDTVELFLKACSGTYSKIIAVEPESRNFRKLKENCLRMSGSGGGESLPGNIRLVNAAIGDHCGTVSFTQGAGRGGAAGKGKARPVDLVTVDSIVGNEKIDLIKMDLEGAESAALRGAEQAIKAFRPRMLVSAYHRTEDLIKIPQQVLSAAPYCGMYLRKDPCLPAWGINYIFT